MAASIGTMFGKVGALMGNILIGLFIDVHCIVPIIVSCSFLISECLLYNNNTILIHCFVLTFKYLLQYYCLFIFVIYINLKFSFSVIDIGTTKNSKDQRDT